MRTIHRRNLFASLAVTIAVLAGLNFAIARAARHLPPRQLLQRIDATAGPAKFVFLGDSQMEADADPVAFSAGCARRRNYPASINVGLGATKAAEHCLVLEYLTSRAPAADSVFYGFYDDLLTQPVPSNFAELGGNRALLFEFPRRAAQLLYPDGPLHRWWLQSLAAFPMISQRVGVWARVERVRRGLAAIGLPPQAENRFGRIADFAAIEPADPAVFEARVSAAVRDQRPFNFSVHEILRICGERRLKFTLIAMPVVTEHRSRYYASAAYSSYRNHVAGIVNASGGRFVDAADWLPDDAFEDSLHANAAGARLFSTRLAQEICADRVAALTTIPNALQNPTLALRDPDGALIEANNEWKTAHETEITATGIPGTDEHEHAILATLYPGNYTAVVRGAKDTTGVALVEAYRLP